MPLRPASLPSCAAPRGGVLLLLGVVVGCAPAGPSAATSTASTSPVTGAPTTGAPSFATSPAPVATTLPTAVPRPSGTLAWPSAFDVPFEPGTYFSSPPFAVPFTIEVAETGWFAGHLHGEFFDLLRFDGVDHDELPTRMVAFADPEHVFGPEGEVPVEGLAPEAAADLIAGVPAITATEREPVSLLGLEGVRVDVRAAVPNTHIFGGAAGDFGAGPDQPFRMAILARDGRLLLVLVLVTGDEVDEAWDDVQPLLESIDFVP